MLKVWWLAIRPKTLSAGVVPILLATALAYTEGQTVVWWVTVCSLISAICIQIATNLFNDAIDFKKGADTKDRLGPKRVTQSGLVSPRAVYIMACLALVVATILAIPLVVKGGLPVLLVGAVSLFLAYGYTGGPWPLAYLGLGDLFVILFFGLFAVGGVYYLHTETVSVSALVLGLQIGLLSTVLIAINNLRDVDQDRLANKKTLPVRFGVQIARFEIYILMLISFIGTFYWFFVFKSFYVLLPFLAIPLSVKIIMGIKKNPPGPIYNSFLAQSAGLQMVYSSLLTLGFLWR